MIKSGRRVGNTTRQINKEIQTLLSTGETSIIDHAHKEDLHGRTLNKAQYFHLKILFDRLFREHGLRVNEDYLYNGRTKTATLKKSVYEELQAYSDKC